jgi:hypothetical protein
MPRARRTISESDRDWTARFALRLRSVIGHRSSSEVAELMKGAGLRVGDRAIDAWLAGRRLPQLKDLERVGLALGIDYRKLLPEPLSKPARGRR